jgi:hypothetical protein
VAACVIVLAAAAAIAAPQLFSRGKCGGSIGTIVDGRYYYGTTNGYYVYTPEDNSFTRLTGSETEERVDEISIVYTKGKSVYSADRNTGTVLNKFTASSENCTHVSLHSMDTETITIWLCNGDEDNDQHLVTLDRESFEPVSEEYVSWDELVSDRPYEVGELEYTVESGSDGLDLICGDNSVLPEGASFYLAKYIGDNLVVSYKNDGVLLELLITPQAEVLELPDGNYLTGCNNYLVFNNDNSLGELNVFDLESRATSLLHSGTEVYTAVTDGTWIFTNSPSAVGEMICWKIEYDVDNKPVSLTRHFSDF